MNFSSLLRFWVYIDQNLLSVPWNLGSICYEFKRSKIVTEFEWVKNNNHAFWSYFLLACCMLPCLSIPFRKDLTENSYASMFLSLSMELNNLLLNGSDTTSGLALKNNKASACFGSQPNCQHHSSPRAVTEKLLYHFTCGNRVKGMKKPKSSRLLIIKYLKIFWCAGFQWLKWPTQ